MQSFPKTRKVSQTKHFSTVLWAMAHTDGPWRFQPWKNCIWLKLLWIPFLLTGFYSGKENLKFTAWKHGESAVGITASSQCKLIQFCTWAFSPTILTTHDLHGKPVGKRHAVCLFGLFCTVMHLNWLGVHLGWRKPQNLEHHRAVLGKGFLLSCILLISEQGLVLLRTQRKMPCSLFLDIFNWELGMEKFQSGDPQIYKSLSGMFCSSKKCVWKLQNCIGGRGRCKV